MEGGLHMNGMPCEAKKSIQSPTKHKKTQGRRGMLEMRKVLDGACEVTSHYEIGQKKKDGPWELRVWPREWQTNNVNIWYLNNSLFDCFWYVGYKSSNDQL